MVPIVDTRLEPSLQTLINTPIPNGSLRPQTRSEARRKTLVPGIDRLFFGDAEHGPHEALVQTGWIATGSSLEFGPSCGAVLGISAERQSLTWSLVGPIGVLASERIDMPIAPIAAAPQERMPALKFAHALANALADAPGLTPDGVLAGVGIAWPRAIGLDGEPTHGEPTRYNDHHPDFSKAGFSLRALVREAVQAAGFAGVQQQTSDKAAPPIAVDVINDADADLLYEVRWGVAPGARSALGVKLCGGAGGSILLDGRIWSGQSGRAGEIEHIPVRAELAPLETPWGGLTDLAGLDGCSCLKDDCIGRFVSGRAIIDTLSDYAQKSSDYNERGKLIEEDAGMPRVEAVFHRAGELLAQALRGPVLAFDPEYIVVSAFPRNESLITGLADVLITGTGIHIVRENIIASTAGVPTTAAGAGRLVIEQRVLPRMEQALLHNKQQTLRRDLPAWLRQLLPAEERAASGRDRDLYDSTPLYRPGARPDS
jgi:predicted NBD/HSP70 family sugar kinase